MAGLFLCQLNATKVCSLILFLLTMQMFSSKRKQEDPGLSADFRALLPPLRLIPPSLCTATEISPNPAPNLFHEQNRPVLALVK